MPFWKGYRRMLVLSRRLNQRIVLPAFHTAIQVVAVKGGLVRLGIDAPPDVAVYREELLPKDTPLPPPSPARQAQTLRARLEALAADVLALRRQLQGDLRRLMETTLAHLEAELRTLPPPDEPGTGKRPPGLRRKALLVEDDPNECELLAGILRLSGIDVCTADDGADALDRLQKGTRPDVLLLNMRLPRCDGPATVRAIRQNPAFAGLKIFAVATAPEECGCPQAAGGVNRWFSKPLNPEVLLRELHRELDADRL
jgi:carbon storage regulator CsrA